MRKFIFILGFIVMARFAFGQYNKGVIVEPVLKTDSTSIGQKIAYPQFENNEVTIAKVTIEPGMSTGWHKHTFPVFAYVLEGELTVEIENHPTARFIAGDSFAEVINTQHNGVNNTNKNIVLIAFFLGEKNQALSVH